MHGLYFKFGAMGSSKTAMALMCKYNYEQKGFSVALFKPVIDTRFQENGKPEIVSRSGLRSTCVNFYNTDNFVDIFENMNKQNKLDVIIVDECQFASCEQINQLKKLSKQIPVLCYGLKTNFKTELFEGSKRLMEIADSIMEIKSVCRCGSKATVNARFVNEKITNTGEEIVIGADECYAGMCYWCYQKLLEEGKNK